MQVHDDSFKDIMISSKKLRKRRKDILLMKNKYTDKNNYRT